jgi:hypothetical protein
MIAGLQAGNVSQFVTCSAVIPCIAFSVIDWYSYVPFPFKTGGEGNSLIRYLHDFILCL